MGTYDVLEPIERHNVLFYAGPTNNDNHQGARHVIQYSVGALKPPGFYVTADWEAMGKLPRVMIL